MHYEAAYCRECKGVGIYATHKWTVFGRVYENCETCNGNGYTETLVESPAQERKPVAEKKG